MKISTVICAAWLLMAVSAAAAVVWSATPETAEPPRTHQFGTAVAPQGQPVWPDYRAIPPGERIRWWYAGGG